MARPNTLAKLGQGTYGAGGEILDWSYYDTATLAAATLVWHLFTIPVGGAAGRTLDITNMTRGGEIPNGQHFTIRNIKVFYGSVGARATADVQTIYTTLQNTTVEFLITGKDSLGTWTLWELLGAPTLIALTPTAAGDNIPLIMPRYHGIFPLNSPIVLAANTTFEVRLTHQAAVGAALAGDLVKVALNGKLRRAS